MIWDGQAATQIIIDNNITYEVFGTAIVSQLQ